MELMKRETRDERLLPVASSKTTPAWSRSTTTDAVCFKVETHNHPSAIEPYGGSATGLGGVIRDVLGTGLAPSRSQHRRLLRRLSDAARRSRIRSPNRNLPTGVIHPKRVLQQVVAGVRDYGNRMGIPTVNGAVYFDDRYLGNPLVFCGCVGMIPRDKIEKAVARRRRDRRHGRPHRPRRHPRRDVQLGRADRHARRRVLPRRADRQRDHREEGGRRDPAGPRSRPVHRPSPTAARAGCRQRVGEMGEKLGATVELDKVPLKYDGLRYDEIWISEAQERMVPERAAGASWTSCWRWRKARTSRRPSSARSARRTTS